MTTLADSGRLAGAHCWAERRLFEVLGAWVASTVDIDAKLVLDRHSGHAAWRAAQWWDRLPVLADVERDALVAPAPGWADLAAALAAEESTIGRLGGAYRVALPRLAVAYSEHGHAATPLADASVIHTLGHVGPDLAADWAEGEALVQARLGSAAAVDEVATTVARLERFLVLR
ncbi:MAG: hypothetical protein ACYC1D_04560 [Acidimicrobiales bacterium]